jgi:hypothetical protein
MIKIDPAEIWKEYQDGMKYNMQLFDDGLYDVVERNNNFYNDRQWEGVNAPDLDKPVFNFLKPVVNYYIAMLISDDIATSIELKGAQGAEDIQSAISQEIENIRERENMQYKDRQAIRNCAVDGDCCFYHWFDPDEDSGQMVPGQIHTDVIDNTNVIFGDPSERDPQKQPYIIIVYRALNENVKEDAKKNGAGNTDEIVPDSDGNYMNDEKNYDKNYTTVLVKMWKESTNGKSSVQMTKVTQTAIVKKKWDTNYRRYPVNWMCWEPVKNSYHGVAPLTGKIQNQIFVNKAYAMAMMHITRMAFPKIAYDKTKIQKWDNRPGVAIPVPGPPTDALFTNFQAPELSASVPNIINATITQTKDLMGANETALGNVQPDNTSAIITVQNQARIQLDMQRLDFYACMVEQSIRNYIDMMRAHYGERTIEITTPEKEKMSVAFDFGSLEEQTINLNIDVGQGSYWSELMQLQTLDNMFKNGVMPNAVTYLESLPDGVIKDKQKIIDAWKATPIMGEVPPGGAPALDANQADTDQMKMVIEELSKLKPKQILNAIDAMPVADEEKAALVEIMKGRGKL